MYCPVFHRERGINSLNLSSFVCLFLNGCNQAITCVCVRVCVRASVRACVRACVCARARARVCVCVEGGWREGVCLCVDVCEYDEMHASIGLCKRPGLLPDGAP